MEGAIGKLFHEPAFHPGHAATGSPISGRRSESSLTEGTPRRALVIAKSLPRDIREGEMSKRKVHHPESGGTGRLLPGTNSLSKEGQLKAVFVPLLIGEVARGIPPLGLEGAVRPMIPWELVAPTGLSTLPPLTDRTLLGANQMRSEEEWD